MGKKLKFREKQRERKTERDTLYLKKVIEILSSVTCKWHTFLVEYGLINMVLQLFIFA